jgi:LysM repeat protein
LISEPQRQGLQLPMDARFKPLVPILVAENIHDLKQVAAQTGIDDDALRALNPGYRSGRIVADAPRLVLIPQRSGLSMALAQADPVASTTPSEQTVGSLVAASAQPGNVAQIVESVPVPAPDPALTIATAPIVAAAPTTATAPTSHQVRDGDTLSSIAKLYGLSLDELRRINGLARGARLKPGQWLKVLP